MRDAGIEPHIENVGDLFVVLGVGAEQLGGIERIPRIDAALLDALRDLLHQLDAARMRFTDGPCATKSAIGTPQVRWREMHQSGRPSTMPAIRSSPHAGNQCDVVVDRLRAPRARRPAWSMLMNHCGVARNATGVLWRQQCG